MAIDFPGSPSVGDAFTPAGSSVTWTWDGGEWVASPAGNWTEAPTDNQLYARRNLAWTKEAIQVDAPNDGQMYRRQMMGNAMGWSPDPIQADAPAQASTYYGRVNGAWGALSPTFTLKTYVDAQDTATLNAANARTNGIAVPVGGVVMFGGATAPTNWLLCNGQTISRSTYATLFAAIGTAYGAGDGSTTFAVPNIGGKFPIQTTPGATGGAGSVALAAGNLPPHYHTVPAHGHGFNDPAHTHGDNGHAHGISDPGHAHSYNAWTMSGSAPVYGQATYYQGTAGSTTGASGTGIGIAVGYASIAYAGTRCSVANAGAFNTDNGPQLAGTAFSLYPPYLGFNFIIRAQ